LRASLPRARRGSGVGEPSSLVRRWHADVTIASIVLLVLVVWLQYRGNAFQGEFDDDDISHYVSGLFIHDYLVGGSLISPLAYLRWWHSHYPFVGMGHWGPFYYGVEGVWMFLFGWSRTAAFLLAATVTAATAAVLYHIGALRFGRVVGLGIAVALALSPLVQVGTSELMLDMPITLLCLLASLAFARYLATGRGGYAVLFGMIATAALLTKGNAGCLALVPPFSVALSGSWRMLRRWSFWAPALIVVPVAGPWYALTYGQVAVGFRYSWGWDYSSAAVPAFWTGLLSGVGPVFTVLGVLGLLRVCIRGASPSEDGVAATMAALLMSVFVFQSVVPAAIQDRYLAPAIPPLLYLAADFVSRFAIAWSLQRGALLRGLVICLALAAFVPAALAVTPKPQIGAIAAARAVWSHRIAQNPVVLVVADEIPEGAVIAELAMEDPARPSLFAVRGSRLLGGGGYNNQDYLPRFASAHEIMAAIDAYAIPFVLVRSDPDHNRWQHIDQVEQARALQPERWKLVYSDGPADALWRLYRIRENATATPDLGKLEQLSAPHALGGG
jgi:4-amino-4-deoxy-L-arabinose transferase-like glycosyltransferase